ncbi:hypothetical protein PMAYCL1PPCAC_28848 [Pristionchus mayeri]|uniref:Uncharacterized protein n=1 Tax=Pristionchus mayeri TaxID=1317129 RepID=A0AAN5D885_9BILA|nr:hypothetical protein PMAYCL1PPCAC_28848 [Pristionchus mayeri]
MSTHSGPNLQSRQPSQSAAPQYQEGSGVSPLHPPPPQMYDQPIMQQYNPYQNPMNCPPSVPSYGYQPPSNAYAHPTAYSSPPMGFPSQPGHPHHHQLQNGTAAFPSMDTPPTPRNQMPVQQQEYAGEGGRRMAPPAPHSAPYDHPRQSHYEEERQWVIPPSSSIGNHRPPPIRPEPIYAEPRRERVNEAERYEGTNEEVSREYDDEEEEQQRFRLSLLDRRDDEGGPSRGRERGGRYERDEQIPEMAGLRVSSSHPHRSSSPDYWAMADEHQRGTKEWLRKMILSILKSYSTVQEGDKADKMITVDHLSRLLKSYDTGRTSHQGVDHNEPIDALGYRSDISWLDFLREMRDEGLLRIHEVRTTRRRQFVSFHPFFLLIWKQYEILTAMSNLFMTKTSLYLNGISSIIVILYQVVAKVLSRPCS